MPYLNLYTRFLSKFFEIKAPLKVVFDSSNGGTGPVLKNLFRRSSPLTSIIINGKPDGRFPAHGPNPLFDFAKKDLISAVLQHKANFGVIFDADGDRAFFVDDRGRPIYPDEAILFLMSRFSPPYVIDAGVGWQVRENSRFKNFLVQSRVGTYFIKKTMKKVKANFGAEGSGHYYFQTIFGKHAAYFDSGIMAAIQMINGVSHFKEKGQKLSEWLDHLPFYYRIPETNFRLNIKSNTAKTIKAVENFYKRAAKIFSHLDGLTIETDEFWFNLRGSNTEPFLRLRLEARKKDVLAKELRRLKTLIKKN
ncbi:MAG: hypothetical protein HYT13_00670 [Candidatus Liptonbacteria bacterium]|nr:hypothetical protein [Candidatus Liptonbacteria bacterium]